MANAINYWDKVVMVAFVKQVDSNLQWDLLEEKESMNLGLLSKYHI